MRFLPKDLETYAPEIQEQWIRSVNCMTELIKHYKITEHEQRSLLPYESFFHKCRPHQHYTILVFEQEKKIELSLVEFTTKWLGQSRWGDVIHHQKHLYYFTWFATRSDYGHVMIRPETIPDKIFDWLEHVDIDFPENKTFSSKYLVQSGDEKKLRSAMGESQLKALAETSGLMMEFKNKSCLLRMPKASDVQETLELCKFSFALSEIL